jgi:p-cumate 2,3-dioxygenase beta subunit
MQERVARLSKVGAHSEWPRSKIRHLVGNIRIRCEAPLIHAHASFAVWRSKDAVSDVFVGHYIYEIVEHDDELRVLQKTCVLDMEALRPHGRISIIL